MTCVAFPSIPNLYNKCEIGLQREFTKIVKLNEIDETGMENLFTKPNHPDLGEETNKTPFNSELDHVNVVEVNTMHSAPLRKIYIPLKNLSVHQRETFKISMIEQTGIQMDYQ